MLILIKDTSIIYKVYKNKYFIFFDNYFFEKKTHVKIL